MEALKLELKTKIIEVLNLEDISTDDIQDNDALFGDGLGLDSIDALELIVMLDKDYGIKLTDPKEGKTIYHLDLYRIKDEEEAIQAGVEDVLYSGELCLVEWPDKTPNLFPPDTIYLRLEVTGSDSRRLTIQVPN